jgi:MYXO-CTERM domain-containing protein
MWINRALLAGSLASACVLSAVTSAGAAVSDINGMSPLLRSPFNAYPNSNLTFTDNLNSTGTVIFDENNFGAPDLGAAFFANRHNAWFSSDAGSTPHAFVNQEDWALSFDLNLSAVNASPRKEAGIFFASALTGSGFFIITTDNGEIATFSSYFPFTSNLVNDADGPEYGGAPYTPGTNVNLKMIYDHGVGSEATGDLVKPASLEFIVNGVSAGVRYLGNLENGIDDGTQVGLFVQGQVDVFDAATEAVNATYSNIKIGTTLVGDLNADGFVGIADLNIVLGTWNESQSPVAVEPTFLSDLRADPSNDNFVGIEDLNLVLGNWNAGTPPAAGSVVPEPAALTLMVLGAAAMLRRRQ